MLLSSLCFYLRGPNTVTYGGRQYECRCLLCVSIFEGRILLLTGGGGSMNVVVFSVFRSSRAEYCYLRGGRRQYECCCLLCVSIFEGRILLLTGGGTV